MGDAHPAAGASAVSCLLPPPPPRLLPPSPSPSPPPPSSPPPSPPLAPGERPEQLPPLHLRFIRYISVSSATTARDSSPRPGSRQVRFLLASFKQRGKSLAFIPQNVSLLRERLRGLQQQRSSIEEQVRHCLAVGRTAGLKIGLTVARLSW